jgi:hypothetical protein
MQKYLKMKKGESIENAITINSSNTLMGIAEEYRHIEVMYGKRDKDWILLEQNLLRIDQKSYDKIIIQTDGLKKEIFFEITSFFGKL